LTPASYAPGQQLVVCAKRFKLKSGANAPRLRRNAVGQQRLSQRSSNPYKLPPRRRRQPHLRLPLIIG
jgi:hypothetical protein